MPSNSDAATTVGLPASEHYTTMKQTHRTTIAAYVSAQRHLRAGRRGAKTLTQMATEIGTTNSTVGRWLRRDHWPLWMQHWASVEDIWQAARQDRQRLPQQEREAAQRTQKQLSDTLVAHLDRCLAELRKTHVAGEEHF